MKNNNYTLIAHVNSKIDNFEKFFFNKLRACNLTSLPTPFYNQILTYWDKFRKISSNCECKMEILNENLWLNQDILIEDKPVLFQFWSEINGINCLFEIVNNDGTFKSIDNLHTLFGIKVNTMLYNSLKSAIPTKWLKCLKKTKSTRL